MYRIFVIFSTAKLVSTVYNIFLYSQSRAQNSFYSYMSLLMINTVEPIFNDISISDNCCYNDIFANPRFFLSLSHVIYFYNNEYKIAFLCYNDNLVRKFRGKTERNAIRFCMRKRSQTFRLAVPSSQAKLDGCGHFLWPS